MLNIGGKNAAGQIQERRMKSDALDTRVNLMSAAFRRLSKVSAILTEKAEELETIAPDVDLLKDYVVSRNGLMTLKLTSEVRSVLAWTAACSRKMACTIC